MKNKLLTFMKSTALRVLLLCVLAAFVACSLCACRGDYYFSKDGIYFCSDPYIEIDCPRNTGILVIGDVEYNLSLSFSNNATYIKLYDAAVLENADTDENGDILDMDPALLWRADTEEKNGKLYLTVTKDNVFDYEGKTIVLEFEPNAE